MRFVGETGAGPTDGSGVAASLGATIVVAIALAAVYQLIRASGLDSWFIRSIVPLVFLATYLLTAIGAGPDIPVPAGLGTWADTSRYAVDARLGPFPLGPPRLVAAACSQDGHRALLTFEAPVTSEQTLVLVTFDPAAQAMGPTLTTIPHSTPDSAGSVDFAWCVTVSQFP